MRLLLIEDDRLIGTGVKAGLLKYGFSTDLFEDAVQGKNALFAVDYDVVVLDLGLPGLDGLDVLKAWRAAGKDTPVLVLTARVALDQRVAGLNLGADDYLGKPFDLEELAARLRALVRRRYGSAAPMLRHATVSLNPENRTVYLNDAPVVLGPKEVLLVELFLLSKQSVLTKAAIEEKLYPWGEEVASNSVEVLVHRVRRKLGTGFIKTVHSVGYTLGEAE